LTEQTTVGHTWKKRCSSLEILVTLVKKGHTWIKGVTFWNVGHTWK